MAIEKMVMFNLIASQEDEHCILEQLLLSEKIHLNVEQASKAKKYLTEQYEVEAKNDDFATWISKLDKMSEQLLNISQSISITPIINSHISYKVYPFSQAEEDLTVFLKNNADPLAQRLEKDKHKKKLIVLKNIVDSLHKKNIDFYELSNMHYLNYELGLLTYENSVQLKKNYENIDAIILPVGEIDEAKETIHLVIYPKMLESATISLLKSVSWQKIDLPEEFLDNIPNMQAKFEVAIAKIEDEIAILDKTIFSKIECKQSLINHIYTRLELEKEIAHLKQKLWHGNEVFVIYMWAKADEATLIEEKIANITDRYVLSIKEVKEVSKEIAPPTILNNNRFFKPFETIVKMYGLPSYNEIDPTKFLGITLCLAFGIMFGDIGQGSLYIIAGFILSKYNESTGGILKRLGASSVAFGFFYGSLFGLEHEQLPWLPHVIGSPLSPYNIMPILMMGVGFGVVVLTISYFIGIANCLKKGDIEEGVFGKNGVFGYVFFINLILLMLAIVGVVPVSPFVFLGIMVVALAIIILKEPLTHLAKKQRPLIKGDTGSYFIESGFEGLETVLSAISNAISFIRVGAFALNHAGLFLAFLVMSEMTDNLVLKIFILVLGNILILTLEGLIVFIQGLRLQYYEMFSKYFGGEGKPYNPIKLGNNKNIKL
ncbi:MAG: hypothetical protein ATN36_07280 [Epulopiscium sp. Nele67-Bin005]|nr:MAG: hypothetical protein ATN36_07280 [Epulopiscium sp. Nele67-Bin005]